MPAEGDLRKGTPVEMQRKRRTREHVIADLSVNHVERFILRCGWIAQRLFPDYSLDLFMRTVDANGDLENGGVWFQLKATDGLKIVAKRQAIAMRLEGRDLVYWLREDSPVVLIVFDAMQERAWWLDLQASLRAAPPAKGSLTVHVPLSNVVDEQAVRHFARLRDAAQRR